MTTEIIKRMRNMSWQWYRQRWRLRPADDSEGWESVDFADLGWEQGRQWWHFRHLDYWLHVINQRMGATRTSPDMRWVQSEMTRNEPLNTSCTNKLASTISGISPFVSPLIHRSALGQRWRRLLPSLCISFFRQLLLLHLKEEGGKKRKKRKRERKL